MHDLSRRIRRLEKVVGIMPTTALPQIVTVFGGLPGPMCATLLNTGDQLEADVGEPSDVFHDRAVAWACGHYADVVVITGLPGARKTCGPSS
jgi:hypothetical protein